ncbi:ester cyclase [Panacibacter ginsenosidivorans]|uniref:Ester cyclase n=1 Tax=Panacibacter ginsenosidivorans TaxID=1813871 RepID=A0A5B8VDZ5_9BACT|nr:ester cyclase [Panacibacter ginsenosidivorans]QEC69542.1 ester cyclase [Panacibacter ginsenosidivorans]
MENSVLVQKFIEQIWNKKSFEMLDSFLHTAFKDHSLLPMLSPDKEGLKKWVIATGISFEHNTTVEDQVTEGDQSMVRIKMKLKHIGVWRGIEPTGIELYTRGYRHFKIKDDRIIEHWALIDGEAIENQLKEASHGCKITV